MRHLALIALIASPAAADEWALLNGTEIAEAVTGRVLIYPDARQDFRASGRTLYTYKGRDSWGYWAVRGDQYCSQWPPNDLWDCYDMTRSGQTLRFIGAAGDVSDGVYE